MIGEFPDFFGDLAAARYKNDEQEWSVVDGQPVGPPTDTPVEAHPAPWVVRESVSGLSMTTRHPSQSSR
jgi:hypothetical protein